VHALGTAAHADESDVFEGVGYVVNVLAQADVIEEVLF